MAGALGAALAVEVEGFAGALDTVDVVGLLGAVVLVCGFTAGGAGFFAVVVGLVVVVCGFGAAGTGFLVAVVRVVDMVYYNLRFKHCHYFSRDHNTTIMASPPKDSFLLHCLVSMI